MKFSFLALALLASGCAYFPDTTDRAAIAAGRVVKKYCQTFNADDRMIFGDKVRAAASPNSITVDCVSP